MKIGGFNSPRHNRNYADFVEKMKNGLYYGLSFCDVVVSYLLACIYVEGSIPIGVLKPV